MLWLVLGMLLGLGLGLALGVIIFMKKIKNSVKMLNKADLLGSVNLIRKLGWKHYFESNLRAQKGIPLNRPYGSMPGRLSWDKIIFNPVYLSQQPLSETVKISTEVVLGPRAKKPLKINIPILIGGMAYGSGYSAEAKIALAKAATMAGTAANSGNGPFLEDERMSADRYTQQFVRGFWAKTDKYLKRADMIEIALGHSARGSSPVRILGKKVANEVAIRYGAIPGLDVLMEARLPEVETAADWRKLVATLKEVGEGVPISVKFGASHYIEQELERMIEGGVDVLTFDGLEGGTHGGMPLLMDDTGLPLIPALCRAAKYLRENGLQKRVSLVVGGCLVNPGDFAKCLALGADAVMVGTITALVQAHTQTTKTLPWEPPTGLLYVDGKEKNKYNPDVGAKHLNYYFQSCTRELELLARCLGKRSLQEFNPGDLVALDPLYAGIAGITYINLPSGHD
ncbi:MAG TPA: FMN-binding glutamate synthase family protein [Bacillota bacterium]|nr:FMN-binding glutamate synthase family protein [Bacillota bacterium]